MTGLGIHRFTATPSTNLDAFCSWVRLHQGCSAHRSARPAVEKDVPSSARQVMKPAIGDGTILSILTACRERGLGVRATLLSGAVVQRAHFIPQSLQTSGDWWFACDDAVGLHFLPTSSRMSKPRWGPKRAIRACCFMANQPRRSRHSFSNPATQCQLPDGANFSVSTPNGER